MKVMPAAIVLINTDIGKESEILDQLCSMKEVEAAFLVYGLYDIAARVTCESMDLLESSITSKIRCVPGIRSTLTLIVSRQCK
jgi:DNA-binding Lrp family transcriptional regulator